MKYNINECNVQITQETNGKNIYLECQNGNWYACEEIIGADLQLENIQF